MDQLALFSDFFILDELKLIGTGLGLIGTRFEFLDTGLMGSDLV